MVGLRGRKRLADSNALQIGARSVAGDVSGVESGFRFEENEMNFFVGDGQMFDAFGDNDEFAGADQAFAIAETHAQRSGDDQKHFIFVIVMMPDELALEFDDFHVGIVEFADDAGIPVIGDAGDFFHQVHGFHCVFNSSAAASNWRRVADLHFLDESGNGLERAARSFRPVGFRINAQHIFGAGSANHHPAEVGDEKLDAVQVFAAGNGPVEDGSQLGIGEIAQGFFFLAVFGDEVNAAVVMFAKFVLQHGDEFTEALTVPGHDFGQKQGIHGGVAFGQVEFGADAAAFLAAEENVAFEHAVANVFEADRGFPDFAAEFRGDLVDHFGGGKSFGDFAGKLTGTGEMPEQDGENLVRIDERAIAIDCADAVGVAVEAKTRVVFSFDHGLAERGDVRLDGFGIHAAEERVAIGANLFAGDSVAAKETGEQAAAGAVHGIDYETKICRPNAIPIDEGGEGFKVRGAKIERLNAARLRRQRRDAFALDAGEFGFDLGDDSGRGGAAVAGFVLHTIPLKRIVAGCDLNASGGLAQSDEEQKRGSGRCGGREPNGNAGGGEGLGGGAGEAVGGETGVVTDQNFSARFFGAHHITGDGVGDGAHVLESEVFGDDGAPAVGAKDDFAYGGEE